MVSRRVLDGNLQGMTAYILILIRIRIRIRIQGMLRMSRAMLRTWRRWCDSQWYRWCRWCRWCRWFRWCELHIEGSRELGGACGI
eukprot:420130-Amorphochlora_amoeboformis.AAC.1